MIKTIALFATFTLFTFSLRAQVIKKDTNQVSAYGKIDTSELTMKNCSFEKDANAMVLFDKADVYINGFGETRFTRHKRIKIFNSRGKNEANIALFFYDKITDISAETINLNGGKITYTKVDPQLIFKQKITADDKKLILAFPDVQDGSVVEIQYTLKITAEWLPPTWYFQSGIPEAYSTITIQNDKLSNIKVDAIVAQPFARDTVFDADKNGNGRTVLALKNVYSYITEPYMTPEYANLQRVMFRTARDRWGIIATNLMRNLYFGRQLYFSIANEKNIVKKADSLKTGPDKINALFTLVRDSMSYNNVNQLYADDAQHAWAHRKGSSAEINFVLCRLLLQAGIKACPMLVSTPNYGIADPTHESLNEFNKCVVMVPVDTSHYYVLDASDKHNSYDKIPLELLNTLGFIPTYKGDSYGLVYLKNDVQSQQFISIKANISADGKITGATDMLSNNYVRDEVLQDYKKLGKDDYVRSITAGDNNLKITDLSIDNMEVDTLPLTQHFNFTISQPAADEAYIYFTPGLFGIGTNPFLNDKRNTDVVFSYNKTITITGSYTVPQGYKVEALPQSQTITMSDKSISCKRVLEENSGIIQLHYVISRKKQFFSKQEYGALHDFYKEMYEMLNEQIVLKKS